MTDATEPAISPPSRLAVIGLGKMGLPMAKRLLGAGFAVAAYDPVAASRDAFAAAGGRSCGSAAEAAGEADAVITMLPDGTIVKRVVLEDDAPVLEAMRRGSVLIEMSSSEPLTTRLLGERLAEAGIGLVDAPVSGGVRKAEAGTLSIMVGGEPRTAKRVRPVLEAMGSALFDTGPLGSAHAMKALNNYVSAAGLIAACEAVQIGAAFGLDQNVMVDILNVSTGRNNTTENKLKAYMISEAYNSGFGLALMAKDIGIAVDLAEALRRPAPLSHHVVALAREALTMLGAQADHTEIDRYLKRLAEERLAEERLAEDDA
ncbi:NAD(P)-dependent oxidoreductase [Methylobacterium gregans]|uniref:2-(Hydroxymethyl)glutarate dehydrogenase n=1 Tax=Methylobacterium gregans TaxID=374424 RepID=A0AA37HNG7_9HYPH|nr:NAD(P)-dependent oxidoreductase [Methylobacterium gregans]MDQ0520369.1 3-hydroxyisobutyrate dehydrogenase [Methylobacterium gregans]GJD79024.1 2-(hydroxymethyl)glutarate dehydrogenase [Methylobacterium gregans]GLS52371.1 2-hydroxy-3-oxopropionate reductase [Methylobacterium gregans]